MQNSPSRLPVIAGEQVRCLRNQTRNLALTNVKARQSSKIREIGEALIIAGFGSLRAQANALGLPRSTAWTIRSAEHKGTGLSARIICRMLSSKRLPALVRGKIVEYTKERAAGIYGGTKTQNRRFVLKLNVNARTNGLRVWQPTTRRVATREQIEKSKA